MPRNLHPFVLFALLSASSIPAVGQNLQGFAQGYITRQISLTQTGAPLLRSFYVRYEGGDHEFSALDIMPNDPTINQVSILYRDQNRTFWGTPIVPRYFYNITFAPYFGTIYRNTVTEFCRGTCTYPITSPPDRANYVFVIRGFYFYYRAGDHHIDELRITEQDGRVTYALNDRNDDDLFRVDLSYAYIPRNYFSIISSRSGSARGAMRAAIEPGAPVIRGFRFDFQPSNTDHHIQEIGVYMVGNGQLDVYYGDWNKDDLFTWSVDYAIVSRFGPVTPPVPPVTRDPGR